MQNKLVAIVDDEPDIVELVSLHLKKASFSALGFADATSFFRFMASQLPALIILDLMLPDADGFEICKQLKKEPAFAAIPIIMLTAKDQEVDKVLGLELGADDYITKPFSPKELVARVKAVLRRQETLPETSLIKFADIVIDPQKHEVLVAGRKTELTSTEFKILKILAAKPSLVFSREHLLDELWGQEKIVVDRTIDVHVNHLRDKLGESGKLIRNVRGIGYKIDA